ncbi:MAG: hypothetical protein JRF63_13580, partial [Deltaproteobacteria bacterium]|nr:hypothetical protein [Deltaproteobacteria bacterium]
LATSCGPGNTDGRYVIEPWIGTGETKILYDTAHQWEARPDFVLDDYEFRYCHSQSTNRLLNNATKHDFRYRQFRDGPLDYDILKQHDILFFNVPTFIPGGRSKPDREMAKLTRTEIDAIERFVAEGGGLFVISEHNNAYDNAEVLNPMLEHFGVQIPASYARDKAPSKYAIGQHDILIRIHHETDNHPVNRKVRETSWLGGGPLETEHGIAFLSEHGHSDFGNYITGEPDKHSNRRVDPGELTGSNIPLVAAVEHGKGRVVVIGDHNVMGVQWLGIADNYRFGMNVLAWLSHRENEDPHIADARPSGVLLGFDLPHTEWNPGIRDRRGYHPLFINFSRDPRLFPMGLLELDDPADVLFFADPTQQYNGADLEIIDGRLKQGQRMVLLFDPAEPQTGTVQLLEHLLSGLVLRSGEQQIGIPDLVPGSPPPIERLEGRALPIAAPDLALAKGLRAAAIKPKYRGRGKYRRPDEIHKGKPYLLDIQIDQGAMFIDAKSKDGRVITVARRFAVGGGELVLFVQPKMWSNETFGVMRDEPVNNVAYGAHDLQLAFARWLADPLPPIDAKLGELVQAEPEGDGGPDEDAGPH